MRATQSPVNASLASADRSSPADKPGTNSDAANLQADRHLTISNSSNSSACCMPSLASQAGPSYDINASARTAEQRQHCLPPSEAHYPQHTTAATQQNHMPGVVQPHSRFPDSMVREMMASMFEDVDSGRHRPEDGEPAQLLPSHPIHHRRRIVQQDSILPAYRPFFPQVGPPLMQPEQQQLNHFQPEQQQLNRFQPEQQQLNHFQLQRFEQILPPELLDRPQLHHPQHAQHTQQQHGQDHQEPVQSSFTSFPDVPPFADDAPRQMPSDMRQWPSPAGSTARQARSFAAAQHDLEDLDITGLKRDFSSFTDPATRARQPQPAPRRALSFTQATPASAASSVAAAAASSAGAGGRRGGSMGQAASTSRLSTPGSHVVSPPDTDASLSDSDDASGSDSAGANTKRRKLIKGKRGAASDTSTASCC